jgi:hypothetical protein
MANDPQDGQLNTLGLLKEPRADCNRLWGASSDAYFRVDKLLRSRTRNRTRSAKWLESL